MGLDAVEIILRTEDLFVVAISDDEAASVRTIGDFYKLICAKLNLTPIQTPLTSANLPTITDKQKSFLFLNRHTPLPAPPEVLPWSSQSVWDCLVAIIVDQQGIKREKIHYDSRLAEDLGID
jgi:acyl carrier protein